MRRSSVKLVLAGSLPLALTACGPAEETYTVSQQVNYESLEACVADQVPQKVCNDAQRDALIAYSAMTPKFPTLEQCEAQFTTGGCGLAVGGGYQPNMSGFELQSSAEVTQSQLDAGYAQGGGYGHIATAAVVAGLLAQGSGIGGRRYAGQPLYAYRDGSGQRFGRIGQRFGTAGGIQRMRKDEEQGSGGASGGGGGYYGSGSAGSSRSSEARSASSASVTRGGFGSQAAARSGWGGRSSSFFGG
ncbi:DUF1190 domain-containing protein [Serratia sp. Se-PFBMAAmG]|nr:DUF1190 domain-containing protein [Serratia sp. Se-PFBMAAmG]